MTKEKEMKRVLIAGIALSMLALGAGANDGHGMGGMGGPGAPPMGFDGGPHGGEAVVASDGTLLIPSVTITAGTAAATVTAVRPTGSIAWTATLPSGRGDFVISGSNLIATSQTTASDNTVTSTLTAISITSGSVAWTRTLTGRVASLEPFSAGTYAVVVTPAATSGGTPTRSVAGIGNDGSVLFTVALP
jgi:hypothetical protein